MGSVSSVYVNPSERSLTDCHAERSYAEDMEIVEVYREENQSNIQPKSTMEIHLRHTFDTDNRDLVGSEMGLTVQYLAQENARLSTTNKELMRKLEMLTKERDKGEINDVEIYGETVEQRLIRLEKTLEIERCEKWKAIEDSERIRVDLINCERQLAKREEDMEELRRELSNNEQTINELREIAKRLESREENSKEISDAERAIRRETELQAFKADLAEKRQIRQTALAAVSSELHKLREDLESERMLRRKLQQAQDEGRSTDDAELVKELQLENDKLRKEVQAFDKKLRSLNGIITKLRSDYSEEKRNHEKTIREKKEAEAEIEEKVQLLREMEMEKERMWADYDREKVEINKRTTALKDVVEISRQMLVIRESQVQELKKKLREIEESVNNSKLPDQKGLREEYEKQLQNIKKLRELYEERVRLMEVEREKLNVKITEHAKTIEGQKGEIESLKEQFGTTSEELKKEKSQNDSLERDLRLSIARSKDFENELSLINNLFTQMLLGPYNTGNEIDLDKLTELLQENHDLITELTLREDSSEIASALPKLLLDLITQVDGNENLIQEQEREQDLDTLSEQSDSIVENAVPPILSYKRAVVFENPDDKKETEEEESKPSVEPSKPNEQMNPAVQEIASNLPKVWRVLMELLSHHTVPDGPPPGDEKQCYKNIETPSGTRSVISVSNTFIRLKDLILEKKALQKELTRLKQLNSHLESRLDDQEKRLSHVQCELHKTWGIVGRMRAQHQQLHNHERILRYELQEKRIMLSELKQELEYCRDKWERARQKNDESETQWQKLRREFAARKTKNHPTANLNDSGESGFSDEQNESGEEGDNCDADRSSTQSPVDGKTEALRESSCDPEKTTEIDNLIAGTSLGAVPRMQPSPEEEKLRQREARLKRLEDQCQLLVQKVDITTSKRKYLNNRLEELHEQYGSTDDKTDNGSSSLCEDKGEIETEPEKPKKTVEEILAARNERLKRLEEQCQSLVGKVTNTVQRGTDLSNRLEDIHVEYVNSEKSSSERQKNATAAEDSTGAGSTPENAPASQEEEKKD